MRNREVRGSERLMSPEQDVDIDRPGRPAFSRDPSEGCFDRFEKG
jgi:hypothetical protein